MRILPLLFLVLLPFGIGCVGTVNPLAEPGNFSDPELVGTWNPNSGDGKTRLKIGETVRAPFVHRSHDYEVTVTDAEGSTLFEANLIELRSQRYIDLLRSKTTDGNDDRFRDTVRVRHIVQYEVKNGNFHYAVLDHNAVEDAIRDAKKKGHPVAHLKADGKLLLTGSTDELREFLTEYGEKVFGPKSVANR